MDINIYVFVIGVGSILFLIGSLVRGFHKGFAHEVTAMVSLIAAGMSALLLAQLLRNFESSSLSGIILVVILLTVFGIVYKILHAILESINFIVRLPLIRWVDQLMGAFIGFVEGFAVLYLVEFLLRNYLLL